MATATITAPTWRGLEITADLYGGGETDEGIRYATFDIWRPAVGKRNPVMLASLTLYADADISPLVWDRYTGDARPGDLKAIQMVRDMLARDYPEARANSYRYTVV